MAKMPIVSRVICDGSGNLKVEYKDIHIAPPWCIIIEKEFDDGDTFRPLGVLPETGEVAEAEGGLGVGLSGEGGAD